MNILKSKIKLTFKNVSYILNQVPNLENYNPVITLDDTELDDTG